MPIAFPQGPTAFLPDSYRWTQQTQSEHPATSNAAGHRSHDPAAGPPRQGLAGRLHRAPARRTSLGHIDRHTDLAQLADRLAGGQVLREPAPEASDRRVMCEVV